MLKLKEQLSSTIKATRYQSANWIPAPLRQLIRRLSGGDQWTFRFIRGVLWQYRYFLALALFVNIAAAFFEGSTMAIFTIALETLSNQSEPNNSNVLGMLGPLTEALRARLGPNGLFFFLVALAVLSQILRSCLQFAGRLIAAYLRAWVEGNLYERMFGQFITMSYPQISRYKIGDLVSYTEQINNVGQLVSILNELTSHFLILVAYVIVLLWLSWPMTLAAVVVLSLLSFALQRLRQNILVIAQDLVNAKVAFNERTIEFLRGIRLIHTFAREKYATSSIKAVIADNVRAKRRSMSWTSAMRPIVESVAVISIALFLLGGYVFIMRSGTGSIPRLITFLFILYRLLPRVTALNNILGLINNDWPFAERVASMLRIDDKAYTPSGDKPFTGLQRGIEFRQLSLSYPESEDKAVDELSFTIPRSSTIAFVGGSGAGKSTIVNLLLRLYEPTGGQILVDGTELQELKLGDWRRHIGVVDQDTFVFNESVYENIRFGQLDATQEQIYAAAEAANAHQFIVELSEGYQTIVGNRGHRLSGGQRQRIAIARAVLRNPDILILDEATSALDSHSEQLIQEALEILRQNRTIIMIAHRLSTIATADLIVVLEDGQIVEQGSHQELLDLNRRYAYLWQIQSKSEAE